MQLVNEFVVPRGIGETWAVLTDVERIAPAMPGAELTGVTDGRYNGKVKVKVGPVTAAYAGVASFRELDEANHHMVLDATGKESSGRGRASALVTADLIAEGAETRVRVTTDLTISGPLAQFGRGAIVEVSSRLLNQFVANLKDMVLTDSPATVAEPALTPVPEGAEATMSTPVDATTPRPTSPISPAPASPAPASPAPASPAVPSPAASGPAPARPATGPAAEVNLLEVAAWPVLKRVIPALIAVAVIVVVIVWLA
jgi:carbon monoxide dehydrogenase subunit G